MLIKTTAKHQMMLQTPPVGRYRLKLMKCTDEMNKKKDGMNVHYEFEVSFGDFEGKPFEEWCPAGHEFGKAKMLMIHMALTGETNPEIEFDPASDVGYECVAEVGHEMLNGNKLAKIQSFLPLKNPVTGAETPLTTPF